MAWCATKKLASEFDYQCGHSQSRFRPTHQRPVTPPLHLGISRPAAKPPKRPRGPAASTRVRTRTSIRSPTVRKPGHGEVPPCRQDRARPGPRAGQAAALAMQGRGGRLQSPNRAGPRQIQVPQAPTLGRQSNCLPSDLSARSMPTPQARPPDRRALAMPCLWSMIRSACPARHRLHRRRLRARHRSGRSNGSMAWCNGRWPRSSPGFRRTSPV